MFAGSSLGLIRMFTGPSYSGMVNTGGTGVRRIIFTDGSSLADIFVDLTYAINSRLPEMYEANAFECVLILMAVSAMMIVGFRTKKFVARFSVGINALITALFVAYKLGWSLPIILTRTDGATHLSLIFFVVLCTEMVALCVFAEDKIFFLNQSFLFLSTFATILPMAVTKSVGGRLYSSIPVLAILLAAESYIYFVDKFPVERLVSKLALPVLWLAFLVMAADTSLEYNEIGEIFRAQKTVVAELKEKPWEEILLPEYLPEHYEYIYYWHLEQENDDSYLTKFKEFYGISPQQDVHYIA